MLLVVSGRMYGGGQRIAQDLWNVGNRQGYELGLLLLGKNRTITGWERALSIEYSGQYNRVSTLLSTAVRLRRLIGARQPTVLHTHGWDADFIGHLACLGLSIKQLIHLHVMPEWLASRRLRHSVRGYLTRKMLASERTEVIAVSHAVRDYWCRNFPDCADKLAVVHNGVNVEEFKPKKGFYCEVEKPVIGTAARLTHKKGIGLLIDALGKLKQRGVPCRLKIAGEGEIERDLESEVRKAGLIDDVSFLGQVDDMPKFYRGVDVFVLPSLSEGMPLCVLEAMASGVPVVASNIGGTPEAIRHKVEGFLVEPESVSELVQTLDVLLHNEKLRRKLGQNGRRRAVDAFSLERFTSEVFAYYQ